MTGSEREQAAVMRRHVEPCMGTVFSFALRGPGADDSAVREVCDWLHWVDEVFSTYSDGSQISRLGRGELATADCAPEVGWILARCAELEQETDGYFSATASGSLDPSGLVKGWAIERASDMLTERGSANHSVNGGGDVQCAGDAADGRPWSIGVTDPFRRDQLVAVVSGTDLAIATSGVAERGEHIVDPHTGLPPGGLASVTVVGTRLAVVDAYATAAFAMGESCVDWLSGLEVRSFVVRSDGTTWASPGFSAVAV